jgi:hypothetical protein
MFRIHALPAGNGDSLLLEYGDTGATRFALIDGGTVAAGPAVLKRVAEVTGGALDLLVVTHVDTDHIGGVLSLFEQHEEFRVRRIWFNGYIHLAPRRYDRLGESDRLGPIHGERLTALIAAREKRGVTAWNGEFDGGTVVVPDGGPLLEREVDGLHLTVLSPTWEKLAALEPKWEPVVRAGGLVEPAAARSEEDVEDRLGDARLDVEKLVREPVKQDGSEANGSSIALLAEYGSRSVLLAGDAHAGVLARSLARLGPRRTVDVLKVPHHGSASNLTPELLEAVRARTYLFCTDGTGFKNPHPHRAAVARVLVEGGPDSALAFNYESPVNVVWKRLPSAGRNRAYRYTTRYGAPPEGLVLDLS